MAGARGRGSGTGGGGTAGAGAGDEVTGEKGSSGAASVCDVVLRADLARGRGVAVVVRRRVGFLGVSPGLESALAGEDSSFFGGMSDRFVTVK